MNLKFYRPLEMQPEGDYVNPSEHGIIIVVERNASAMGSRVPQAESTGAQEDWLRPVTSALLLFIGDLAALLTLPVLFAIHHGYASHQSTVKGLLYLGLSCVVVTVGLNSRGAYELAVLHSPIRVVGKMALNAIIPLVALIIMDSVLCPPSPLTAGNLGGLWLSSCLLGSGFRWIYWAICLKGNPMRILIVGVGKSALELFETLRDNSRFEVAGFLSLGGEKEQVPNEMIQVTFSEFGEEELLRMAPIHGIIFAVPIAELEHMDEILRLAQKCSIKVAALSECYPGGEQLVRLQEAGLLQFWSE